MIKNTVAFFQRAKDFQDKRSTMVAEYKKKLAGMEKYKGSDGYKKEVAELQKAHTEALESLRDETRSSLRVILDGMEEAIQRRKINAPSNEQLNLIHLLKMRERVTAEELDRVAEMVKDNGIAMGVIQEIARENDIHVNYTDMCSEMSSQTALSVVNGLRREVMDWTDHDTVRSGRLAMEFYKSRYKDTSIHEEDLRKRPLFNDIEGCFSELSGMDKRELALFSEVVDA